MNDQALRIVFAGTPEFAAEHLKALLERKYRIVGAYTQPDARAGRGNRLKASPVKELAQSHDIPVFQPDSLKSAETQDRLRALSPDVMVVVAYGLILPAAVIAIPRHGCLNVHASLLPRWRGAAPVERAILAGDRETGVSIMQMDTGLDTGDVLYSLSTPIRADDNSVTLSRRLAELGRQALLHTLRQLGTGSLTPVKQNDAQSTYAAKLQKEEAVIDWRRPAEVIQRQVNAFYPRMPVWCLRGEERVRILEARALETDPGAPPGTIVKADGDGLDVQCAASCLRILRAQLPGKKPVSARELLNARREQFAPGTVLGPTRAAS